jgi:hypothetical protein
VPALPLRVEYRRAELPCVHVCKDAVQFVNRFRRRTKLRWRAQCAPWAKHFAPCRWRVSRRRRVRELKETKSEVFSTSWWSRSRSTNLAHPLKFLAVRRRWQIGLRGRARPASRRVGTKRESDSQPARACRLIAELHGIDRGFRCTRRRLESRSEHYRPVRVRPVAGRRRPRKAGDRWLGSRPRAPGCGANIMAVQRSSSARPSPPRVVPGSRERTT